MWREWYLFFNRIDSRGIENLNHARRYTRLDMPLVSRRDPGDHSFISYIIGHERCMSNYLRFVILRIRLLGAKWPLSRTLIYKMNWPESALAVEESWGASSTSRILGRWARRARMKLYALA